jgi:hypothetical protein
MALSAAPGGALASDTPDFGEDMRVAHVAWKPVKAIDAHTILIRGPRVSFCSNKPALETVVTEQRAQVVIDAYSVRPDGPETKCLKRTVLSARVSLAQPIGARRLYDGSFSPPLLRPLPLVPGEPTPST